MKKLIFSLLITLFSVFSASSQSLDVIDFKADASDLSAVVHQVADLNGDPCALVKVGLTVPNATFEGDIIKSEYKDGEYWVYMVDGANWLTVKTSEYTPLRIDDNFGPLKGNTTYILTLAAPSGDGGSLAKTARIPIELPAKGAGVSIGGRKQKGSEPVKFDMILVKSGMFKMGATPEQSSAEEDELPVHWARFTHDFYIGETEVSQALWEYVMADNPSIIKDDTDDLPVENITWEEAQEFCKRLSQITGVKFRLPTEAEWEYAARGGHKAGTATRYAGSDDVNEVGWFMDNAGGRTHNVKSKKPNELGLYNMSGNVWELCEDYKNDYPKGEAVDYLCTKPAKNKNRVRRGGGWDSENRNQLRTAYRRRIEQNGRARSLGLRVAMDL